MNKRTLWYIALSSLLSLALTGCSSRPEKQAEEPKREGPLVLNLSSDAIAAGGLTTQRMEEAPWSLSISATGNLDYDANRMSPVSARVPGRVAEIRADLGQSLAKGQILCLIDSPEAGEAQAAFLKAFSEMNLKQKSYDRARMLLDAQAISQGEFLERQAGLEAAKSEFSLAENRLHLLGFGQDEVDHLRDAGDREVRALFPVRSPISGRVVERKASPGLVVDGTAELFKVADLSKLWLNLHLPEKEIVRVRKGQAVSVAVMAYPDLRFEGVLDNVGNVVELESRMVLARVILPNPDWKLLPGMFAEAAVQVSSGRRVLSLPEAALQLMEGGPVVFVKRAAGAFEARPVKTGEKSGERIEIVEGLKPGEEVVVQGSLTLKAEALKAAFGEE
jgi:cobalt-zinc-cadmium efflux system membrane fusion protein